MTGGGDAATAPTVRRGTAADAGAVARLHAGQIADGFLSRLGPRFLTHLYRCVATGPDSFLLVAAGTEATTTSPPDTAVAGYIAGALDLRRLYRRFALRHGLVAAVSSGPRLVASLPQVWETLRHGAEADDDGGGAELLAVAVDPGWRGHGIGGGLVEAFLAELERRRAPVAQVVVGADNAAAVALYRGAGFAVARTFELHRGTPSLLMRRGALSEGTGG